MEPKKYTYLVEVIFEYVDVSNPNTPEMERILKVGVEIFFFAEEKKSEAKQNAQKFYDKTLRYGLERKGGSVVKSLIAPNCIKNIAIVDFEMYKAEQDTIQQAMAEAMAQEAKAAEEAAASAGESVEATSTPIPSQVEGVAEAAAVNMDVAAN